MSKLFPCARCGAPNIGRRARDRCDACYGLRVEAAAPVVDATTRYLDDRAARELVRAFPDGMSHRSIGEAMGLCRERIRQIEADAVAKLTAALGRRGIDAALVASHLASKPAGDVLPPSGEGRHAASHHPPVHELLDLRSDSARAVDAALRRITGRLDAVLEVLAIAAELDEERKGRAA